MGASKLLLIVAAILLILAALVAQGVGLAGIHAETFALLGLSAWAGSGAV